MTTTQKSDDTKDVSRHPRKGNGDQVSVPGELTDESMAALRLLSKKFPVVELTMAEAGFVFPEEKGVLLDEIRYGSSPQYRLGDKEVRAFEREGEEGGNREHQETKGRQLDEQQLEKAKEAVEQQRHDFPEKMPGEEGEKEQRRRDAETDAKAKEAEARGHDNDKGGVLTNKVGVAPASSTASKK